MRIFFDTTVLVDVDRQKRQTIQLLEELSGKNIELMISTITVSEILYGVYFRRDFGKAVLRAREALGQFVWVDFDGEAAEKTGEFMAFLRHEGKSVEFQDVAIAASATVSRSDFLLTQNTEHFIHFPQLKGHLFTPEEFAPVLKKRP